jgi:uncharacterized membrane protein
MDLIDSFICTLWILYMAWKPVDIEINNNQQETLLLELVIILITLFCSLKYEYYGENYPTKLYNKS